MEEGVFPHSRRKTIPEELEEERRLCYVGNDAREGTLHSHAAPVYRPHLWLRNVSRAPCLPRFLQEFGRTHRYRGGSLADPVKRRRYTDPEYSYSEEEFVRPDAGRSSSLPHGQRLARQNTFSNSNLAWGALLAAANPLVGQRCATPLRRETILVEWRGAPAGRREEFAAPTERPSEVEC